MYMFLMMHSGENSEPNKDGMLYLLVVVME